MRLLRRVRQLERALRVAAGRPLVVFEVPEGRHDHCAARIAAAQARGQRVRVIRLELLIVALQTPAEVRG